MNTYRWSDRKVGRQVDTDKQADRYTDRQTRGGRYRYTDSQTCRKRYILQIYRQADRKRYIDIQTSREAGKDIYSVYTDSQTGRTRCINILYRQAVRQADKQRQAGRPAGKEKGRQTCRLRDRHRSKSALVLLLFFYSGVIFSCRIRTVFYLLSYSMCRS